MWALGPGKKKNCQVEYILQALNKRSPSKPLRHHSGTDIYAYIYLMDLVDVSYRDCAQWMAHIRADLSWRTAAHARAWKKCGPHFPSLLQEELVELKMKESSWSRKEKGRYKLEKRYFSFLFFNRKNLFLIVNKLIFSWVKYVLPMTVAGGKWSLSLSQSMT